MPSDGLTRYYGFLTALERVPLLVAAAARGDRTEVERLARSAPAEWFHVPDYWGLMAGLERLAYVSMMTRLDLVVRFREATGCLTDVPPRPRGRDKDTQQQVWEAARLYAYLLVMYSDAWGLLCRGLGMDPEAVLRDQPGYDTLRRIEEPARATAFTAAEALACLVRLAEKRAGGSPEAAGAGAAGRVREGRMDGAAEVAQSWREQLEEWAEQWE